MITGITGAAGELALVVRVVFAGFSDFGLRGALRVKRDFFLPAAVSEDGVSPSDLEGRAM
jgi:hypothetical protein